MLEIDVAKDLEGFRLEAQVSCERCRLVTDPFHEVAVTGQDVSAVIDHFIAETRRQNALRQRHPHRVAETLAERPRRRFDSGRGTVLRVPRRAAVHATVEAVKRSGRPAVAGFVNALLRRLATLVNGVSPDPGDDPRASLPRGDGRFTLLERPALPDPERDELSHLAARWSHPRWLVQRIKARETGRVTKEGVLRVVCQVHREQGRNLAEARERLATIIRSAMQRRKKRVPTKPTAASRNRRLDDKKRRSHVKRTRGRVRDDE